VLDLVPFARARWEVAYFHYHACRVRKLLQFHSPQSCAGTVAAATIGRDQQSRGLRVSLAAKLVPPSANRSDRKLCGIATNADRHPCFILTNIVNTVGNSLILCEVMCFDSQWVLLFSIRFTCILMIPNNFLLLRVDGNGNGWLPSSLLACDSLGNELELGISIRMLLPFDGLSIGLLAALSR